MDVDAKETIATTIRMLKGANVRIPRPEFRFLFVPDSDWERAGDVLGQGVALLDAPDNNFLIVSATEDEGPVMIPTPEGEMPVVNHPMPVKSDDEVISLLGEVIEEMGLEVEVRECEDILAMGGHGDILPLMVEATRIRRRGIPLCTPLAVGGARALPALSTFLFGVGRDLKIGVLCLGDSPIFEGLMEMVSGEGEGNVRTIRGEHVIIKGASMRGAS